MKVRATTLILDEGLIMARPGDVGDVLDSERLEDGVVALTVKFPGVPRPTTCVLGESVEAILGVAEAPVAVEESPAPEVAPPEREAHNAPRRSWRAALAFGTAAAVALVTCWGLLPELVEVDAPSVVTHHGVKVVLTDGQGLPKREAQVPPDWMREPCPNGPAVRTYLGACFIATAERPPCSVGHELKGECVVPVGKGQRIPTSMNGAPK